MKKKCGASASAMSALWGHTVAAIVCAAGPKADQPPSTSGQHAARERSISGTYLAIIDFLYKIVYYIITTKTQREKDVVYMKVLLWITGVVSIGFAALSVVGLLTSSPCTLTGMLTATAPLELASTELAFHANQSSASRRMDHGVT